MRVNFCRKLLWKHKYLTKRHNSLETQVFDEEYERGGYIPEERNAVRLDLPTSSDVNVPQSKQTFL